MLLVLAVLGAIALMVIAGQALFDQPPSGAGRSPCPQWSTCPVETAEAKIRAADLVPEVQEVPSTKEEGTVVDQNPQANEQVPRGSKVTLSVSAGPNTVELPDLAGFTQDEATTALRNVDLTVGTIEKVEQHPGREGQRGRDRSPPPARSVAVGSAVSLKVVERQGGGARRRRQDP